MHDAAIDRRSWDTIAGRLRPFIARRVGAAADADDVLQEVLLRVHRGLPELRDDDRVGPWMFRIARNAIVDHLRVRSTRAQASDDAELEAAAADNADEQDAAQAVVRALASFVADLPSPYREAITLTELEGRTQREGAEMLGIGLSAMKSRVQRGRAKLREMLDTCCEIALDTRGHVIACAPRPGKAPNGCAC
ncbi:MAG TPA: RNA polymerase sigma factor SigZ [Nannocystaceae bacterium]|nr:RNA polymerase sigma factor SigZ [Nannocystaceae bacterium]